MSHVVTISVEVKDLDALETACASLGLELVRGKKRYKWYGRSVGDYALPAGVSASDLGKCDHAIRIPGSTTAYEIGVVRQADGSFRLLWDFWNGGYGMEAAVGRNASKLRQSYAGEVAIKTARKNGFRVLGKSKRADGSLVIRVSR